VEAARFPVEVEIPVAWGDMDSFGHVNNTVYLRWCETARISYFERVGLISRMESTRVGPILARATVDFRAPVRYPDTVVASASATRLGTTSFTLSYKIHSRAQATLVAEGDSVVVLVDYARGGKVPLDDGLRAAIQALETGTARVPSPKPD
jgi:acyl-CoA thioester hydrolase